ncbi:MAG TPA: bifunctional isocitrate dehydrogenase kinase/phosphatase [Rhizobacter sp.]|nr:bifunctional isocitrate dehydrogenase kinase/phosphatase [Rhizobacter sp.]
MFPHELTDLRAFDIAGALLEGFNRHYTLFRAASAKAKRLFERADWHAQQRLQRERIEYYDLRVSESVERLASEFGARDLSTEVWQQVKLHYIGRLTNHHQPELAETFFNSVTTRILARDYFHNSFIFVRPAVSTEYIEDEAPGAVPTYRAYYPAMDSLHETFRRIVTNMQLECEFEDLERDVGWVVEAVAAHMGEFSARANFQVQVLSSLFFRNKGAYLVGKLINGWSEWPFALPILHADGGRLVIDTALFGEDDLQLLFSFARAYFMVDTEVPSACVQFLSALMPNKPRAEIYNAIGLQKHGKNLFYRDFLAHLRHSSDRLRIAQGIKGMVMLVFDLPSFPYVFKVIKDSFPPQKETTRELVKQKYLLVKQHDRAGRMADTLEFANVAFPRSRFDEELVAELKQCCAGAVDERGDEIVLRHVYIERRMVPLNLFLQDATPPQLEHAVLEYGNAIKDMVATNIFPGDMLWKNFGVTRHGKVVFYDYDEIEYLTDCHFRRVPLPRNPEEDMSAEVWFPVGPRDVFPETFAPFLLGNPAVRKAFMATHADLLDVDFWQRHRERILAGHVHDVFPYEPARRFSHKHAMFRKEPAVEVDG